jgi:type III secretory pathway component EscT
MFLLVLMMSFGGILTAWMMTSDGSMQDCPYMGEVGYCNMNISEHLASWQQLFTSTLEHSNPLALLPLLTLFVLAYFFVDLLVRKRTERPLLQRWRKRELFDPLQLAFARGLIHPKLYS